MQYFVIKNLKTGYVAKFEYKWFKPIMEALDTVDHNLDLGKFSMKIVTE